MAEHGAPVHGGPPRRADLARVDTVAKKSQRPSVTPGPVHAPGPPANATMLWLQGAAGNTATRRLVAGAPGTGEKSLQRVPAGPPAAAGVTSASPAPPPTVPPSSNRVAFVREEGLNLRTGAEQGSSSVAQLPFGTRVHVLEDESLHPGWQKVATPVAAVGFLYAPRVHFPPPDLLARDPGVTITRIRSGQTFWGLVKEQYGIQGNESTADQNINHFINAIRAVNKSDAFIAETGWLDDIGNWLISGRDASDTLLKAGYDLWIPSFGVAAAMDVGSGTVTGEVSRIVQKIEQKIEDFRTGCSAAVQYIPEAIARHAGATAMGLLTGLIDFAIDAARVLAASTAAGALIGALFGGVGAVPGAQIGFEIGLMLLEYYGLAMLIEAVLGVAGNLFGQLGSFISQVWSANGDAKKLDAAGRTLADALGVLVSALLAVLAAYLLKRGTKAFSRTRFARSLGERPLAQWLKQRQQLTTTRRALEPRPAKAGGPAPGHPYADLIRTLKERVAKIRAARGDPNVFRAKLREVTFSGNTPRHISTLAAKLDELLTPYRRSRVVTGGGRGGGGVSTYIESLDGRFSIRITHNQVGPAPVGSPPFPRIHVYEGPVSGHGAHVCLAPGTALADILTALKL